MPATTAERKENVKRSRTGLLGFIRDFHNRTILFRLGNWIFVTYGLVAGVAFFVGWSMALWYNAMCGVDTHRIGLFYLFIGLPAILIGARAFSLLQEWRELFTKPLQTLIKPGFMLHGGICGYSAALYVYALATGNSFLLLLDAASFAMPLGEALCRLGCYVYGCCWGSPTGNGFGVRYTSPHAKVIRFAPHLQGVRIHPAQIYAFIVHLAQFAVLYMLLPYKLFDGMFTAIYLSSHAIIRFCLEWFRGDDRGKWGPLTHTNVYSLLCIFFGALAWIVGSAGGNTPVDLRVRWIDVVSDPMITPVVLVSVTVMLVFGLHHKQVGSWISDPSVGCGDHPTRSCP